MCPTLLHALHVAWMCGHSLEPCLGLPHLLHFPFRSLGEAWLARERDPELGLLVRAALLDLLPSEQAFLELIASSQDVIFSRIACLLYTSPSPRD